MKTGAGGSLHRLRHTVATHLLMQGTPIQVVSRLLGHSSLRTTSIYTHALEGDLQEAVNRLKFGKHGTLGTLRAKRPS